MKPIRLENLKPQELRTIYDMGRVIMQAVDSAAALKEITLIARPVFIFDNVVLYQPKDDLTLEPIYARSVGRGRTVEADMAWGESIAQDVLHEKNIIIRQENLVLEDDDQMSARLNSRFFLGLPLVQEGEMNAALIFIRFGGPEYLPEQVNMAQLIAEHIEHLLEREILVNRIANLEADRKLVKLQQEFVATVSHDLRSPLGFIKGYATTLLRDDTDWNLESRREFLTIIDEEADRLSGLIDNLLDSSRLQSGTLPMTFKDVKIDTFLTDFSQRMQMGDFNIEVCLDIENADEKIWIDSTRMIQVFDNLVSNAIKYAPGTPITFSLCWEPENVHIAVSDKGPGIPEGQLEHIFKRFYRLVEYRDVAKGSGLGLFICKQIVNAHNGEIYAKSTLGEGTVFHILLPRGDKLGERNQSIEEV
jgi:signal transduction histidine kinase